MLPVAVLFTMLGFGQPVLAQDATPSENGALSLADLPSVGPEEQMLVEADELIYDSVNETVTAQGNVQIYYGPYTLQADRVVYDQKAQRVRAEGNVRVTEPDGNVIYAEFANLSDDFRDGFVRSLTVETPDKTRITAATAERSADNTTVFNRGVYTACEPCEDDPSKPPLWQIKAVRIVHDQKKKMIYYENASLEFFGLPVAYFPFFATPDPSVKRKTGFLTPGFRVSNAIGFGVVTPYFINVAPNKDITLKPLFSTRQGLLMEAEWRHRMANGTYSVRAGGIRQLSPDDSPDNPGDDRDWRGYISSQGRFAINRYWSIGWDGTLVSDDGFLKSYSITGQSWLTSTVDLTGQSERNHFEARAYTFRRLNAFNYDQSTLPVVAPSTDYSRVWNRDVFGGELSFASSSYSTYRGDIDSAGLIRSIARAGFTEGDYADSSRYVAELKWRRQLIDGIGQVFTPFASVRGDIYNTHGGYNAARKIYSASWLPTSYDDWQPRYYDDETTLRVIPTVGVEYRYPFASHQSWGTQVFEPVAQLYYRPNLHGEQDDVLNEDALSLVFDTTSLFDRDKFSGYDRVETGLRANLGVRYTANFSNSASARLTFGRSFHLAGDNPFPEDSGLEHDASDYVGSAALDFGNDFKIAASTRIDGDTFAVRRNEIYGQTRVGRLSTRAVFAQILKQPGLGSTSNEAQLLARSSFKLSDNWNVSGYGRYDFAESRLNQTGAALSYSDECFYFSLGYNESYDTNGDVERSVAFSFNLRTLGGITGNTRQFEDEFGANN
ncbi:MAG: LPS-assembly protein LptD [Rhodobiaceae bacterium]|nr:LPS-assembly protein LptD [Rhodobiaceae bacterium]